MNWSHISWGLLPVGMRQQTTNDFVNYNRVFWLIRSEFSSYRSTYRNFIFCPVTWLLRGEPAWREAEVSLTCRERATAAVRCPWLEPRHGGGRGEGAGSNSDRPQCASCSDPRKHTGEQPLHSHLCHSPAPSLGGLPLHWSRGFVVIRNHMTWVRHVNFSQSCSNNLLFKHFVAASFKIKGTNTYEKN